MKRVYKCLICGKTVEEEVKEKDESAYAIVSRFAHSGNFAHPLEVCSDEKHCGIFHFVGVLKD